MSHATADTSLSCGQTVEALKHIASAAFAGIASVTISLRTCQLLSTAQAEADMSPKVADTLGRVLHTSSTFRGRYRIWGLRVSDYLSSNHPGARQVLRAPSTSVTHQLLRASGTSRGDRRPLATVYLQMDDVAPVSDTARVRYPAERIYDMRHGHQVPSAGYSLSSTPDVGCGARAGAFLSVVNPFHPQTAWSDN